MLGGSSQTPQYYLSPVLSNFASLVQPREDLPEQENNLFVWVYSQSPFYNFFWGGAVTYLSRVGPSQVGCLCVHRRQKSKKAAEKSEQEYITIGS